MLRKFLHVIVFFDWSCAVALFVWRLRTTFFRANEYLDRRGSLSSLRRPLPSEFSKEYYASYRQSAWLALAFLAVCAIGVFLLWIEHLIYGPSN